MLLGLLLLAGAGLSADEKYDGPNPPKSDIPYLVQATKLMAAEVAEAREEQGARETTYVIAGGTSPARTPEAEPVFIIDAREIAPDHIELYLLDVKDGNREVSFANKAHKGSAQPLHLLVTHVKEHLYKIEASEMLATGEYALSPSGDNRVFCFEVY